MTAEDLLSELRSSRTDLARLVEAARDRHTRLVIPQRSVEAWQQREVFAVLGEHDGIGVDDQQREPETWTKVSGWLTAHGVSIVRV